MTERVQSDRRVRRLFGSDKEDKPPSPILSSKPSSTLISVRDGDDGVSHRGKSSRGTFASVGTILTVKCVLLPLRKSRGFYQNGYLLAFLGRRLLTINTLYLLRPATWA